MVILEMDCIKILRKIFLGCQIQNCKFSKVNVLKNGRSGAYGQEETCLKFNQTKGNVKATLVMPQVQTCSDSVTKYRQL